MELDPAFGGVSLEVGEDGAKVQTHIDFLVVAQRRKGFRETVFVKVKEAKE